LLLKGLRREKGSQDLVRISRSEVQSPKSEVQSSKSEVQSSKSEVRGSKSEVIRGPLYNFCSPQQLTMKIVSFEEDVVNVIWNDFGIKNQVQFNFFSLTFCYRALSDIIMLTNDFLMSTHFVTVIIFIDSLGKHVLGKRMSLSMWLNGSFEAPNK
jgi:hypothetical protein